MPWFQTMLCNLDQGEKCHSYATPTEFPGQLTEWPDWFEPHKPSKNESDVSGYDGSGDNYNEGPTLQECLDSEPSQLPKGCIPVINNAFNELRKFICPGYIRPTQGEEEDSRQARLLATIVKVGFVDSGFFEKLTILTFLVDEPLSRSLAILKPTPIHNHFIM